MPANCMLSLAAISAAASSRSSRGASPMKASPAFGVLVKCTALSPGSCTTLLTPGVAMAISPILRIAASVRSMVAPSGSCSAANRNSLSCVGMKPPGTARKPMIVTRMSRP